MNHLFYYILLFQIFVFQDNIFNVELCDHYNGHLAVITQNTDRLKDGKYALAELNAFKYNIQGTSFLNPYASDGFWKNDNENINYESDLLKIKSTGRISFGMYWRSDSWVNPRTGRMEFIPSYYQANWHQDAIDAGFKVVLGESKKIRYPNHGQQLYDISDGSYGYNFKKNTFGKSRGSELYQMTQEFVDYFKDMGIDISTISYENGQTGGSKLLLPFFLGGRNSSFSYRGDSTTLYGDSLGISPSFRLNRVFNINRLSSSRTWDAVNAGRFKTQSEAITYTRGEIAKTILNGGWFSDFMHWHSLYEFDDLAFFDTFYSGIRKEIGNSDVWMAGYSEAVEYMYTRDAIGTVGSFERNGETYVFYQVKEKSLETTKDGIEYSTDNLLNYSPVSIKIDLTGSSFEGRNIVCDSALSIRSLGSDQWVLNLPYENKDEGCSEFEISIGTQEYYSNSKPIITNNGNGRITVDLPSKFVIWRKPNAAGIEKIEEVDRVNVLSSNYDLKFKTGYTYYYNTPQI